MAPAADVDRIFLGSAQMASGPRRRPRAEDLVAAGAD